MSENQNYIDLKINGRFFPLWMMLNFKQYGLKKFGEGDLASKTVIESVTGQMFTLKKYQALLGSLLTYKSKQKNALVYHGLGSGKTATAINVYNVLFNYNPKWNVFILIKASLHDDPWLKDLKKFLPKNEYEQRMKNITFIHYDAPNADKIFIDAIKASDSSNQNIYIFDEAHNFIRNVYGNIMSKSGRRALTIYEYIKQEKEANDNSRVLLLTGTPAVNEPYELALIFNLLRPNTFPDTESEFKRIYISNDENGHEILNPNARNMFQRRIMGLVSYYIGSDPSLFASTTLNIKKVEMSDYQKDVYSGYEYMEEQMERNNTSTYKTYTRQSSNFVFPPMGDYNGENRPRPSKFKISEKEAEEIIRGRSDKVTGKKKDMDLASVQRNIDMYINAVNSYIEAFKDHLDAKNTHDKEKGHTLKDDIEIFKTKYKYKYKDFMKKHENKSSLLKAMHKSSAKFTAMLFYSLRSVGPIIIFSNFVKMEGIQIIKIYMSYFGFKDYRNKSSDDYYRYTEFHGDVSKEERKQNMTNWNNINNLRGEKIKIVLVAPAGAEGINLKYVRQIHIMDPYWNEVRIRQLIGRGLRMDSHLDLPKEERHIDVFRYHAVKKDATKKSTDQKIFDLAEAKQNRIDSFLLSIKEVAFDCELFKNHNMNEQSYSCFQFNQKSYFNKLIGPAYKQDVFYDSKINDGLNALNSEIKKIKVYEIQAKIRTDDEEFTEVATYWYDPKTGIVYDHQYDFPLGKIQKTNGVPDMLENDTYVIDETIAIPRLKRVL